MASMPSEMGNGELFNKAITDPSLFAEMDYRIRMQNQANRVMPENACPRCGENHIDQLAWIPEDYQEVRCATCGTVYTPGEGFDTPVVVQPS